METSRWTWHIFTGFISNPCQNFHSWIILIPLNKSLYHAYPDVVNFKKAPLLHPKTIQGWILNSLRKFAIQYFRLFAISRRIDCLGCWLGSGWMSKIVEPELIDEQNWWIFCESSTRRYRLQAHLLSPMEIRRLARWSTRHGMWEEAIAVKEGFEIKLNFMKIAQTEIDLMNILLDSEHYTQEEQKTVTWDLFIAHTGQLD